MKFFVGYLGYKKKERFLRVGQILTEIKVGYFQV